MHTSLLSELMKPAETHCRRVFFPIPPVMAMSEMGHSLPAHFSTSSSQCLLMALRDRYCSASEFPLSGEKRTLRGHGKSVVRDPERSFAAQICCDTRSGGPCGEHLLHRDSEVECPAARHPKILIQRFSPASIADMVFWRKLH